MNEPVLLGLSQNTNTNTNINAINETKVKVEAISNSTNTFQYHRLIFVGDIHGCYDELVSLLQTIDHNPERDTIYFVGDLVVKGTKSQQVVELVRNLPNSFCVKRWAINPVHPGPGVQIAITFFMFRDFTKT